MIATFALLATLGQRPEKPTIKLPPLARTIAWLPPFAPLLDGADATTWRVKTYAALVAPKVKDVYVPIPAKGVVDAMKTLGLDATKQKSSWKTDEMLKVGAAVKARWVGRVDFHPIQPNTPRCRHSGSLHCEPLNLMTYGRA